MSDGIIKLHYLIPAGDLALAGEASSGLKKALIQLGVDPAIIKKAAVAMYEAEINAVIHAGGGVAQIEIDSGKITIKIIDKGPGIHDIDLAMKEGYSTASDEIREMGFGAGMGLPNMKRYSDKLEIDSVIGIGTTVTIEVKLR